MNKLRTATYFRAIYPSLLPNSTLSRPNFKTIYFNSKINPPSADKRIKCKIVVSLRDDCFNRLRRGNLAMTTPG
jgi:hypothetical protein